MQTRIKFCGMTRLQDVHQAVGLGVDALGFVFVQESARYLTVEQAQILLAKVPPFVARVGLFMNAESAYIQDVLDKVRLNMLQFHGSETEEFCNSFNMPYLKAVPMGSIASVAGFCSQFPSVAGVVLDSHTKGKMGGSGEKFEWSRVPPDLDKPIVLAGGLNAGNIATAIQTVRPYAVDVSSGIEAGTGAKDLAKMELFVKEARHV